LIATPASSPVESLKVAVPPSRSGVPIVSRVSSAVPFP
jgi:hypothetical protein